jgi:DNA-binding transcriptional LysR family regulator
MEEELGPSGQRSREPRLPGHLATELLSEESLVLVASPEHPLSRASSVLPEDLEGASVLLTERLRLPSGLRADTFPIRSKSGGCWGIHQRRGGEALCGGRDGGGCARGGLCGG